jgi:multiple sugar transport system permease protein
VAGEKGFRKWAWVVFFLAPSLIGLLVFILGPVIYSLVLTLFDWNLLSSPKFIGFGNFADLYHDADFWLAFRHTLTYLVLYVPFVLAFALVIALLLHQPLRGKAWFRTAFFVPVVTSWVAVSVIWKWVFNPRFGLVNYALAKIGINGPAWLVDPDYALYAVVITSVWKDMGFFAVMFLSGLQGISESYYEAAKIDGAGARQRLFHITLPLLTPMSFFAVLIALIFSFQVFEAPWLMPERFAQRGASVIVGQIVDNAFRYNRMGYAAAMSWVLFAVIFAATLIQFNLQKRWVHYEQ